MTYEVHIEEVAAMPLAAVADRSTLRDLPQKIIAALDLVWPSLRRRGIKTHHNVVVYHAEPDKNLLMTDAGVPIEAGVQVLSPCEPDGPVVISATPAGRAATTVHMGPYDQLGAAHGAVLAWCREHGHAIAGVNWEVYGDWSDKPEEVRTDVYYLLNLERDGT